MFLTCVWKNHVCEMLITIGGISIATFNSNRLIAISQIFSPTAKWQSYTVKLKQTFHVKLWTGNFYYFKEELRSIKWWCICIKVGESRLKSAYNKIIYLFRVKCYWYVWSIMNNQLKRVVSPNCNIFHHTFLIKHKSNIIYFKRKNDVMFFNICIAL